MVSFTQSASHLSLVPNAGLDVSVVTAQSDQIRPGAGHRRKTRLVGTQVKKGTTVTITVSGGGPTRHRRRHPRRRRTEAPTETPGGGGESP